MKLLLVRHGQSEWNASHRLQGQADIRLSDVGRHQADGLRPVIEAIRPCRAISSDLKRVRETASRISSLIPEFTEDLREIDLGDWTGKSIPDLIEKDANAYARWRAGTYTPPSGESWSDFVKRISRVIGDQTRGVSDKNLLVVCHGGVIRALLQLYLDLEPNQIIPVSPASLTVIQLADNDRELARLALFNYRPAPLVFDYPD